MTLLPCPSCGTSNSASRNWQTTSGQTVYIYYCDGCKDEGPPALTDADAQTAWNQRAVVNNQAKAQS